MKDKFRIKKLSHSIPSTFQTMEWRIRWKIQYIDVL